jgi:hypothetical protein
MGFTPSDIDDMTLWEFDCCYEGYQKAHQTEEQAPPPMADDQLAELGVQGF